MREWWRRRKGLRADRDTLTVLGACFALDRPTLWDLCVVTGLTSGRVRSAIKVLQLAGAVVGTPRSDGRYMFWATQEGPAFAQELARQLARRHLARKAGVDR